MNYRKAFSHDGEDMEIIIEPVNPAHNCHPDMHRFYGVIRSVNHNVAYNFSFDDLADFDKKALTIHAQLVYDTVHKELTDEERLLKQLNYKPA